ncbi:MAG: hypothetical protein AAGM38_15170 [Pseudomonadota bacterium]
MEQLLWDRGGLSQADHLREVMLDQREAGFHPLGRDLSRLQIAGQRQDACDPRRVLDRFAGDAAHAAQAPLFGELAFNAVGVSHTDRRCLSRERQSPRGQGVLAVLFQGKRFCEQRRDHTLIRLEIRARLGARREMEARAHRRFRPCDQDAREEALIGQHRIAEKGGGDARLRHEMKR